MYLSTHSFKLHRNAEEQYISESSQRGSLAVLRNGAINFRFIPTLWRYLDVLRYSV